MEIANHITRTLAFLIVLALASITSRAAHKDGPLMESFAWFMASWVALFLLIWPAGLDEMLSQDLGLRRLREYVFIPYVALVVTGVRLLAELRR